MNSATTIIALRHLVLAATLGGNADAGSTRLERGAPATLVTCLTAGAEAPADCDGGWGWIRFGDGSICFWKEPVPIAGTLEDDAMQTRFSCPACSGTHVLDFPEDLTIYMTCGQTGQPLALRSVNGNPKAVVVDGDGRDPFDKTDAE